MANPKILTCYCALCDNISMNYKINYKKNSGLLEKVNLNGKSCGMIIDKEGQRYNQNGQNMAYLFMAKSTMATFHPF